MGQIEVLIDFGVPYVRLEDYRAMQARLEPAVARAEAAEAELADLTERHENEMAKLIALVPSLRQRAEKAETRLAELEAAARWRPVADPPGRDGYYKTACIDLPSETDRVYYSRVGGWDYDIDFWQPLPAGDNGPQKENKITDNKVKTPQRTLVEVLAAFLDRGRDTAAKSYLTLADLLTIVETADNESTALIAQIAALREFNRWRPVSETPTHDKPVLALMKSGEYKVVRYVTIGDVNGVPLHHWRGTGGSSKHVACWRPIVVPVTKEEKQHD